MICLFLLFFLLNQNLCNKTIVNRNISDVNNTVFDNALIYLNKTIINKRKNLIMGIIEKYTLEMVLPFFKSLIHSNFNNCETIMFVRNVSEILINYLKSLGVVVYEISKEYKNVKIINLRWKMYIDFLKEKKYSYNLVYSADVRDTFFQKDIFKYYENHDSFLGIALEDGTLLERHNKKWIIDFIGEEIYKTIQNQRIICVGSIWGTVDKFLEFSTIFWEKLIINPQNVEQGIGNYLIYYEKKFKDCIVTSDNYGPVMTIGITPSTNISCDKENNVLNFKGEIAAVVHQYDRKPNIVNNVMKKYCPELLITNYSQTKMFNEINMKSQLLPVKKKNEYYENIILFFSLLESFTLFLLIKVMYKKKR